MRFRVENLGPLREAEVDLSKDLILLTGPNNSGKTYLAWSVYGLTQYKPADDVPSLDRLVEGLLSSPHKLDLQEFRTDWQAALEFVAKGYGSDLHRCFAAEIGHFEGVRLDLAMDDSWVAAQGIGIRVPEIVIGGYRSLTVVLRKLPHSLRLSLDIISHANGMHGGAFIDAAVVLKAMSKDEEILLSSLVRKCLTSLLLHMVSRGCTLFPAERIAVNIFAKELALRRMELVDDVLDANAQKNGMDPIDLVKRRAGRYPLPIRDSLQVANDLSNISKRKSSFADLADDLETALLCGKVSVSEYGEMIFIPNGAPDRRLSVHLTASVVKSLASLVFYFRHMAQENDFIIIDEPELNLHPDNQRKIARILAKAVNRGFKIMMSTHSDYIIRELNNLIMLNQKSEAADRLIDELGYDRASLLDREKVGVYLFNDHRSQPVEVTETGFEVKTIDEEINSLNLVSQRIYGTLFD